MTREEAIEHLLHDGRINLDCDLVIKCDRMDDFFAAVIVAIDALKGPTREMVERMRGTWYENKRAAFDSVVCSSCGKVFQAYYKNYQFCPHCGKPKTDKAVDMMLRRWKEAMDGEKP